MRKLTLRRKSIPSRHRAPAIGHPAGAREAVADILGYPAPSRLAVGSPDDAHEREADANADRVMALPEARVQRQRDGCAQDDREREAPRPEPTSVAVEVRRKPETGGIAAPTVPPAPSAALGEVLPATPGRPLPASEREFFETRMNAGLGSVRLHVDGDAARLSQALSARAFTWGRDVFFGAGEYRPGSVEGRRLIAHELTHVLQHERGNAGQPTPEIRRKLALRPPGKGERSAFARAGEFVDRLNQVSPAIQYELKGQDLGYTVKDPAALTHFDRQMMGFIDRGELVPMRLINHEGRVGGGNLFADSFVSAYVDLDDLLADDIYSFQSDLLHFLTERFQVKDYERKVGTDISGEFPKAHRAGKDAEAEQLRALFRDPSIVFVYEETKANDTWVNAFKSKANGFWVFQVVKRSDKAIAGGEMWVKRKDGSRVSMDDFRKERAAAAP